MAHCGHCSISDFLEFSWGTFLEKMKRLLPKADGSQEDAWKDCFIFLKRELPKLTLEQQQSKIIFEYELENQTRPDVLILTNTKLIILEFKSGGTALADYQSHYDQVVSYYNRFRNYHIETYKNNIQVEYFLVYTNVARSNNKPKVLIASNFIDTILKLIDDRGYGDPERWIKSSYEPTPDILKSVDSIFTEEDLPTVMTSRSNIEAVTKAINDIINNQDVALNVVFVSGDPGAGKTLLGLKLVKDNNDLKTFKRSAKYLTGNEPLCLVLQHEINEACQKKSGENKEYGEAYVIRAMDYINNPIDTYLDENKPSEIREKLVIFDEGQRAWDNNKIQKSINKRRERRGKRILNFPFTEGGFITWLFARAVENSKTSKTIVCLIGDGQEIHDGEEMGIKSWIEQIVSESQNVNVTIHAPSKYSHMFTGLNVKSNDLLHLSTYHRGYAVNEYPTFINDILNDKIPEAKEALLTMEGVEKRYPIYITESMEKIKRYFSKDIYNMKKFGIISSSFGQDNLLRYHVTPLKDNGMRGYSYRTALGKWYRGDSRLCKRSVSEFDSQGLEIDFPILFWCEDLIRKQGRWYKNNTITQGVFGPYDRLKGFDNPLQILKNIYRVLLTRGREGIILWIPYDQYPELNETYEFFKETLEVKELQIED
jgi:hypothetical protein